MAIFNGYVGLPEGNRSTINWFAHRIMMKVAQRDLRIVAERLRQISLEDGDFLRAPLRAEVT